MKNFKMSQVRTRSDARNLSTQTDFVKTMARKKEAGRGRGRQHNCGISTNVSTELPNQHMKVTARPEVCVIPGGGG